MPGLKGLLVTLTVFGSVTAVSVVVTPKLIRAAGPAAPAEHIASDPDHQAVLDGIAAIVSRSHAVLAVHERGSTPYLEIVLWLMDTENVDTIDPEEVAVISHSEVMQTLTFYERPEREEAERTAGRRPRKPPATSGIDPDSVREPRFCVQWRGDVDVIPRVVGTAVTKMQATWVDHAAWSQPRLQISLSWSDDVFDTDDRASVLVDARTYPTPAKEPMR